MEGRRLEREEVIEEEEEEVRWANHYSSLHHILLVGEGDFSFSLSLADAFGTAVNIVATSYDSYATLLKKYNKAQWNVKELDRMGATILHEVDATKMKLHVGLRTMKFDRIVFNFPHAGFKGKEEDPRLINLHRELVHGFFRNAIRMLRPHGEVHISHKTAPPFCDWKLEETALKNSLVLAESVDFFIKDYPGYNNKRGDGHRSDNPFHLGKCATFKFVIGRLHKRKKPLRAADLVTHSPLVGSVIVDRFAYGDISGDRLQHAHIGYPEMRFPHNFERTATGSIGLEFRVPAPITPLCQVNNFVHEFSATPTVSVTNMAHLRRRYNEELVETSRRVAWRCNYQIYLDELHRWSLSGMESVRRIWVRLAQEDEETRHRELILHHGRWVGR